MGVRIIPNERVKGEITMNFGENITGSDMTKESNAFELRAAKLPADYQEAWENKYISYSQTKAGRFSL